MISLLGSQCLEQLFFRSEKLSLHSVFECLQEQGMAIRQSECFSALFRAIACVTLDNSSCATSGYAYCWLKKNPTVLGLLVQKALEICRSDWTVNDHSQWLFKILCNLLAFKCGPAVNITERLHLAREAEKDKIKQETNISKRGWLVVEI